MVENADYAWYSHCWIDTVLLEREIPKILESGFVDTMYRLWFLGGQPPEP